MLLPQCDVSSFTLIDKTLSERNFRKICVDSVRKVKKASFKTGVRLKLIRNPNLPSVSDLRTPL